LKNSLDYSKTEGKVEEKLEIARNLKILGLSFDQISKATNLTKAEIERI
jgi:predicted transposase/invertase (TIGR01784 family)